VREWRDIGHQRAACGPKDIH